MDIINMNTYEHVNYFHTIYSPLFANGQMKTDVRWRARCMHETNEHSSRIFFGPYHTTIPPVMNTALIMSRNFWQHYRSFGSHFSEVRPGQLNLMIPASTPNNHPYSTSFPVQVAILLQHLIFPLPRHDLHASSRVFAQAPRPLAQKLSLSMT